MLKRLGYIVPVLLTAAVYADGPFRELAYEAALKAAAAEKKIVVIDFYTTWCGPCKMLDNSTWKDDKVIAWFAEKAVALKIDAEKQADLAKQFRVKAFPSIIFIKPDGTEIDRIVGYRPADQFIVEANEAISGRDSLTRAKAKLDANPDDPMLRSRYARELASKGRHEEALKEYLWCFDKGRDFLGFGGVRRSFLLNDIVQLGREYPAALAALQKRRDRAEEQVLAFFEASKADGGKKAKKKKKGPIGSLFDSFRDDPIEEIKETAVDAVSLSDCLGEDDRPIAFYDRLREIGAATRPVRVRMMYAIDERLTEARRYKDVLADGAAPLSNIERAIDNHEEALRYMGAGDDGYREYSRKELIKEIGRNYEVLLGVGDFENATMAAEKLLKFESSATTFSELIRRAVRAGNQEIADEHVREARLKLSADEFENIDRAPSAGGARRG